MTAPLAAPTGGRPALHEGKRVRTVTGAPGRAAGSDSWREIRRDLITWLVLSDIAAVISPGLVLMAASPRLGGIVLGAGGLMLVLSWAGGSLHVDVVDQARTGAPRIIWAFVVSTLAALVTCHALLPDSWWASVVVPACAQLLLVLIGRHTEASWLRGQRIEGRGLRRTLIIMGAGAEPMLYQLRRHPGDGFLVVGYLPTSTDRSRIPAGEMALGRLREVVRSERVDVVMTLGGVTSEEMVKVMRALETTGARLIVAPGLQDVVPSRMRGLPVSHGWTGLIDVRLRRTKLLIKDVVDRVLGTLLLLVAAPILLTAAAAVRLDSPGPALYKQTRVGEQGRPFTMWKLRSMYTDADARRAALVAARGDAGNEVLFKDSRDPRITRVGRLLRRASIDELPQLINVVKGDMSLVGPRPALPEEVARYDAEARRRLLVKPGLTGLWQVSGRSDLSWETSVAMDRHYVENRGGKLDTAVLASTLKAVIGGRGAY